MKEEKYGFVLERYYTRAQMRCSLIACECRSERFTPTNGHKAISTYFPYYTEKKAKEKGWMLFKNKWYCPTCTREPERLHKRPKKR